MSLFSRMITVREDLKAIIKVYNPSLDLCGGDDVVPP